MRLQLHLKLNIHSRRSVYEYNLSWSPSHPPASLGFFINKSIQSSSSINHTPKKKKKKKNKPLSIHLPRHPKDQAAMCIIRNHVFICPLCEKPMGPVWEKQTNPEYKKTKEKAPKKTAPISGRSRTLDPVLEGAAEQQLKPEICMLERCFKARLSGRRCSDDEIFEEDMNLIMASTRCNRGSRCRAPSVSGRRGVFGGSGGSGGAGRGGKAGGHRGV